jgi:guanine nucleotide-binding protein G(i) subunit alpha
MREARFNMGDLSLHVYNIGSIQGKRHKWIHQFESVFSIIFVVNLASYDQLLPEEPAQNRMVESLILFDSIVNSRWFMRTSIILFLSNLDQFKEKLARNPLGDFFPDYSGGNNVNRAAKYILWRFSQVNRAHLDIYPHLVQSGDVSNLLYISAAIRRPFFRIH